MYWFVIYAEYSRTRARVKDPHAGPPEVGSWLTCAPPDSAPRSTPRYTAILAEREWRALCEYLGLDFEQACLEEARCALCEVGPLPVLFLDRQPVDLPGVEAATPDMRIGVAGPMAAIALEPAGPPATLGVAIECEVRLCVTPLPESDAERDRVHSLFSSVAFNVAGVDAELRCPDCASPELRRLGGTDITEQMGCDNCGARLARDSAFLRLGDCEEILASSPAVAPTAAALGAP